MRDIKEAERKQKKTLIDTLLYKSACARETYLLSSYNGPRSLFTTRFSPLSPWGDSHSDSQCARIATTCGVLVYSRFAAGRNRKLE
jgi:hypothetical protein